MTRATNKSTFGAFANWLTNADQNMRARTTMNGMSDAQLRDIGLTRADLQSSFRR